MTLSRQRRTDHSPKNVKKAYTVTVLVMAISIIGFVIAPLTHAIAGPTLTSLSSTNGLVSGGNTTTLNGSNFSIAGKRITAISGGGGSNGYALASDGTVYSWGNDSYGQLGNGHGSGSQSYVPVAVTTAGTPMAGKTITAISGGDITTYALASDGTVYSWGDNYYGQLGNGNTGSSNVPVAVTTAGTPMAGKTITAISGGGQGARALASDGTVYSWGSNDYGQLGNGTSGTNSNVPVAVTTAGTPMAGKTITAISGGGGGNSGGGNGYALASDGTVYSWGSNPFGQLGNGTSGTNSNVPVAVTTAGTPMAGKTITAISGDDRNGHALASDGTVYSWGDNYYGQFGNGTTGSDDVPVAVTTAGTPMAGKTITAISGGYGSSYALASDGTVYSWGNDTYGELGNGTTGTDSNVPVAVTTAGTPMAGKTITAISGNYRNSYALASDGTVYSWGWNTFGALGNGTTTDSNVPVAVLPGALINPLGARFGGIAATNVTYVDSTHITATIPAHAVGTVDVSVSNGDGQTGTLANSYTYTAAPGAPSTASGTTTTPGAPNTGAHTLELANPYVVVVLGIVTAGSLLAFGLRKVNR